MGLGIPILTESALLTQTDLDLSIFNLSLFLLHALASTQPLLSQKLVLNFSMDVTQVLNIGHPVLRPVLNKFCKHLGLRHGTPRHKLEPDALARAKCGNSSKA